MAEHAELAFVKNLVTTLAAHQPTFSDDFQQEPELQLKRVPVLNIAVPPPPERAAAEDVAVSNISVTFKSSKPAFSSTIDVSPADSIASIKARIASSHPSAPPADALRLLLKGKALADSKLAKDYGLKDADVVNVMVKPGFETSTSPSSTPTSADAPPVTVVSASSPIAAPQPKTPGSLALPADSAPRAAKRGHGRIPSVVLSPSPSPSADGDEVVRDIPLVDEHGVTISAELEAAEHAHHAVTGRSSYHAMVATPEYWQKLFAFMNSQFPVRSDAMQAFEDYLNATKGALTASEIARIRDHVGVTGMAGT